jgi:putative ABC transport system permease protein
VKEGGMMFKNYLKIAVRNLLRYKTYSFINFLGLACGMACTILILLWVQDELIYDRFHKNKDDIYRIGLYFPSNSFRIAQSRPAFAHALKNAFPEIVDAVRYKKRSRLLLKNDNQVFYEDGGAVADPSFFNVFTFPFLKGDPNTALSEIDNVVITENLAYKYFKNEDPMNKLLFVDGDPMKVTGVIKDVPEQSHLQFTFISSIQLLARSGENLDSWGNCNLYTYIKFSDDISKDEIINKSIQYLRIKTAERWSRNLKDVDEIAFFQSLKNIHLNSDIRSQDDFKIGDMQYIHIFIIIAIFILVIACINYINLSTARATMRKKEVGIKKVIGSNKYQLFKQFLSESLIFSFETYILAIILVELFLPTFNNFVGKHLSISILHCKFIFSSLIIVFFTGILAGAYPAFYLSSFQPMQLFRNTTQRGLSTTAFRKMLIVVQFLISIALIISTLIIYDQLNYIRNYKLGFDKDNVIYLRFRGNIGKNFENFRNELRQNISILGITAKNSLPIESADRTTSIQWPGKTPDQEVFVEATAVDWDYIETMNLSLIAGRNFSREFSSDLRNSFILNEKAVKQVSLESPIGKPFSLWRHQGTIIGVVKNVHFSSLRHHIEPQVLYLVQDLNSQEMKDYGVILIKIKEGEFNNSISYIEATWNKINPNFPFEFRFLDTAVENQYQIEKKMSIIFNYFTLLSIFIACLGLFGLVSFTIEQRLKEIGIRNVVGASVKQIVMLLTKDFTKLVLLANLIAWPVAYYAMNRWLQNFAYRIEIEWWVFLIGGGTALVIALLTVSWQAIRAATANPVEALRYE